MRLTYEKKINKYVIREPWENLAEPKKNLSLRSNCYDEKSHVLQSNDLSSKTPSGHVDFYFEKTAEKIFKISFLSVSVPKHSYMCFFLDCIIFLEQFFSATRMQLWLPSQKVSAEWLHVLLFTSWKNCRSRRFTKKFQQGKFQWPIKM